MPLGISFFGVFIFLAENTFAWMLTMPSQQVQCVGWCENWPVIILVFSQTQLQIKWQIDVIGILSSCYC